MRLREIKQILDENFFQIDIETIVLSNTVKHEIINFQYLYKAIRNIEKFNFINKEMEALDQLGNVFYDKSERVIVDNTLLDKLREIVDRIRLKVEAVCLAINDALPEQNENSVSIKLPGYTDLKKVATFIKEIDIILNQSLVNDYKTNIKLQNFDTGSNWIEIIIENKESIKFLGSLIACTYKFIEHSYLSWMQTEHSVNALKIEEKNAEITLKTKQAMLTALEESVKMQTQSYASALMKDFDISDSQHEYHTELSHSIYRLVSYITEGAEVHTALNAPEETKQAFPDNTITQSLIQNATKLLPNDDSNVDDSESEDK